MEKHHFQKIYLHINNLDKQLNQLRLFSKKIARNIEASQKQLIDSSDGKKQIMQKSKDATFKKELNNFDYLQVEKEQIQANAVWLKNLNIQAWIESSKEPLKNLKQQVDKLQKKMMKQQLKQAEIASLKTELHNRTVQHKNNFRQMLRTLAQWNIKNNCQLLQVLTSSMQRSKTQEKSNKNNQAQPQSKNKK